MSWASVADALQWWPTPGQAPDQATLQTLLDVSTQRLEVFAPPHVDPPAEAYRYANVLDAYDLWAWSRDTGQDTGTMFDAPLTFSPPRSRTQVTEILRPRRVGMIRG